MKHAAVLRLLPVLAGTWAAALAPPAAQAQAVAEADPPRAFGYTVGDVVERRVRLLLPPGQRVDTASLPPVGGRGKPLELRSATLQGDELTLVYQVFLAPREVRTLEMPPLHLDIVGGPRAEALRIDAWPVTVAPLTPDPPSPRRGLGELRPDAPPPAIATEPALWRLAACGAVAALLGLYLALIHWVLPWWARGRRPFGQAWRHVAALPDAPAPDQRREAWQRLHGALNQTAGEVLFEPGLERFLAAHPAYARLRGELQQFFQRSRAEFFGSGQAGDDGAWLRGFCRRCRDVERGDA